MVLPVRRRPERDVHERGRAEVDLVRVLKQFHLAILRLQLLVLQVDCHGPYERAALHGPVAKGNLSPLKPFNRCCKFECSACNHPFSKGNPCS